MKNTVLQSLVCIIALAMMPCMSINAQAPTPDIYQCIGSNVIGPNGVVNSTVSIQEGQVLLWDNQNWSPGCYGQTPYLGCSSCQHNPNDWWGYNQNGLHIWWNLSGSFDAGFGDYGNGCTGGNGYECDLNVSVSPTYTGGQFALNGEQDVYSGCEFTYTVPPKNNDWLEYRWNLGTANLIQDNGNSLVVSFPPGTGNTTIVCEVVNPSNYATSPNDVVLYTDQIQVDYTDLANVQMTGNQGIAGGAPTFCPYGNQYVYTLSNSTSIPSGSIIDWTVPFGTEIFSANANNTSISLLFNSNAISGNVTASIETPCGEIVVRDLYVELSPGLPITPDIIGPSVVCQGTSNVIYFVPQVPNANYYQWSLNQNTINSGNFRNFSFPVAGIYTITVIPYGDCGPGAPSTIDVQVVSGGGQASIDQLPGENHASLNNAIGGLSDFELLMNPCEQISSCIAMELDKSWLELDLDLGDLYEFGHNAFNADLEVKIDMYDDYSGGSLVDSQTAFLNIQENQPKNRYRIETTIDFLSIKRYEFSVMSYNADAIVQPAVRFQARYFADWKKDARTINTLIDVNAMLTSPLSSKYHFEWDLTCSDLSFDNYEIQILKIQDLNDDSETGPFYSYGSTTNLDFEVDWSKALIVETQSNLKWIDLTMAEGEGYYLWRVRPIGNYFVGGIADDRNWGLFSPVGPYSDGYYSSTPSGNFVVNMAPVPQIDESLNWIYSRVFVEAELDPDKGVKIGESMSYANGLNQSIVNQNLSNENGLIVNQSIYDYSARPVVQTLPAPVDGQNSFGFNSQHLMKEQLTNQLYNASHFDECVNFDNPLSVLDDVTTVQAYYSDNNVLDPIANAEGFPFARTLYANDGRVKEQSAPGLTLKLNGDVGKTTKTYFSGVMQDELLRIFGDEAPLSSNCQKVITVDPNGTATGVYKAKSGETLASFLIYNGKNEYPLTVPIQDDISQYETAVSTTSGADNLLVGLESQLGSFTANEVIDNHLPFGLNGVQSSTVINTAEPFVSVGINYEITPNFFENECSTIEYCTVCDYDVNIKVLPLELDVCSGSPALPIYDHTILFPGGQIADCNTPPGTEYWPTTSVTLNDPGSYIVLMTVNTHNIDPTTISTSDPSGSSFLEQGMDGLESLITNAYQNDLFDDNTGWLTDAEGDPILMPWSGTGAFVPTINPDFSLDGMYDEWINGGIPFNMTIEYDLLGQIDHFTYLPNGFCEPIIIPYLPCALADEDCSTFPFENDFNQYWIDKYATDPDLTGTPPVYGDLFANSQFGPDLSPVNYPPSAFPIMISNMMLEVDLDGDELYACSDVMMCWEFLRDNYLDIVEGYASSGSTVQFDFIAEFLACTGTNYYGFTNDASANAEGAVYGTDGINDPMPTFDDPASFITHAYSFFYHEFWDENQILTLNNQLQYCYSNCLLEDGDPLNPQCIVPSSTVSYLNNVGPGSTANFNFPTWSWNDPSLTPEEINNIWYMFLSCESNINNGLNLPAPNTNDVLQDVNDQMVGECMDRCNSLYDDFYDAIIDEYYAIGNYISTDQYYLEPTFATQADYDAYQLFLSSGSYVWPNDWTQIYNASQNGTINVDDWIPHQDFPVDLNEIPSEIIIEICEIECLAAALLEHCKETCEPSWYEVDLDGDGIIGEVPTDLDGNIEPYAMEELLAIQEVLISTSFDLTFPDPEGECPEGYDHICVFEPAIIVDDENDPTGVAHFLKKTTEDPQETECWTCSKTPTSQEFVLAINDALDNFLPFIDNSFNANTYIAYEGWEYIENPYNQEGRFEWTWDHPYFEGVECPRDNIKIIINLVYKCNSSYNPNQIMGFASSSSNIYTSLGIYDIMIRVGASSNDIVFYSKPGDYCINETPTLSDMLAVAPHSFTDAHFAFDLNTSNQITLDFANPPNGYYGSYFANAGDAYIMHWTLVNGGPHCGDDSGGDPLPNISTSYEYWECESFNNLLPFCDRECPETDAEICFDWSMMEIPEDVFIPQPILCEQENTEQLVSTITTQIQEIVTNQLNSHYQSYLDKCADPNEIMDELSYNMAFGYHHYTLYCYDRAGNLISTVPPEGVNLQEPAQGDPYVRIPLDHRMKTTYDYNSLNQLTAQSTPDGGATAFGYNDIGQLRFSQNAKQVSDATYSYTKYDHLSRIIEVGVCQGDFNVAIDPANINDNTFPNSNLSEVVQTFYSESCPSPLVDQNFLQNRVSYTVRLGDGTQDDIKTIYSYDAHGNVETVYQHIPDLGVKSTSYEYDLVSGNVICVIYQKDQSDQFMHKYSYDSDNRIEQVYTSFDGVLWDRDAEYDYYKHGTLSRTEIGQDKVQGLDFIYTLNGWLKSINHPTLTVANDIGNDGDAMSSVAKDAFGMQLNYFAGDYKRSSGYGQILDSAHPLTASINGNGSLYNGNISSWFSQVQFPDATNEQYAGEMMGYTYKYDELNRLVQANFNHHNGSWNSSDHYYSFYTYDANGNLEHLKRRAFGMGNMDELTYHYEDDLNGKRLANRLYHYKDEGGDNNYHDLQPIAPFDGANVVNGNNFRYDEIGNLEKDISENIDLITWLANGKVESVIHEGGTQEGPDIYFQYDALGNRISKLVVNKDVSGDPLPFEQWEWTYYVRDASGNVMAIYDQVNTPITDGYNTEIKWAETPLYGSSRIGMIIPDQLISSIDINTTTGNQVAATTKSTSAIGTVLMSYDKDTDITKPIVVSDESGELEVLDNYGEYEGEPSPAVNLISDKKGTVQFSVLGLNHEGQNTIRIFNAEGDIIEGSEEIVADMNSEMEVIEFKAGQLYYLFSVDDKGKLLYHQIDMTMNDGLGGIPTLGEYPAINIPLSSQFNFRSKMSVIEESELGNKVLITRRIEEENDVLHFIYFDDSRGIQIEGHDVGRYFTSATEDEVFGMELSTSNEIIAMTVNEELSNANGFGKVHILQKNVRDDSYKLTDAIIGLNEGELGDLAISPESKFVYYLEYTPNMVYVNQYDLLTGEHNVIMEKENDGEQSSIMNMNDGKIYVSNFNVAGLQVISNPDQIASELDIESKDIFLGGVKLGIAANLPAAPIGLAPVGMPAYYHWRALGQKRYELNDHLSNVRATITDVKIPLNFAGNGLPFEFESDVTSAYDYYAFGMTMPGRQNSGSNDYRYGFNGKEKDEEIKENGNSLDFGARLYDSRLGRWLGLDPLASKYPSLSAYIFAGNMPIIAIDPDGKEIRIAIPEDSDARVKIEKALEIIRELYPDRYEALDKSEIVYEISIGSLNETAEPVPGESFTYGVTETSYTTTGNLTVSPILNDAGEITGGSVKRHRTAEEQEAFRNENPGVDILEYDNNLVPSSNEETAERIEIDAVQKIIIDPQALIYKKRTAEVVGHELLGHSWFNTISSIVQGFIWSEIGEESKKGHDKNNPGGIESDNVESNISKNYKKAKKAIKERSKSK